jgi:hypothetical protein
VSSCVRCRCDRSNHKSLILCDRYNRQVGCAWRRTTRSRRGRGSLVHAVDEDHSFSSWTRITRPRRGRGSLVQGTRITRSRRGRGSLVHAVDEDHSFKPWTRTTCWVRASPGRRACGSGTPMGVVGRRVKTRSALADEYFIVVDCMRTVYHGAGRPTKPWKTERHRNDVMRLLTTVHSQVSTLCYFLVEIY